MKNFLSLLKMLPKGLNISSIINLFGRFFNWILGDVKHLFITIIVILSTLLYLVNIGRVSWKEEANMFESQIVELQKLIKPLRDEKVAALEELAETIKKQKESEGILEIEANDKQFWKERVEGMQQVIADVLKKQRAKEVQYTDSIQIKNEIIYQKNELIKKYQKRCK